jgi:hypothetical protein
MTNSTNEETTTTGEATLQEVTTTMTVQRMAVEAAPASPKEEPAADTKKRESPDAQPNGQPEAKKITVESSNEKDSTEEELTVKDKPAEDAAKTSEEKSSKDTIEKAVDKEEEEEQQQQQHPWDENDKPKEAKKLDEAIEETKPVVVRQ